MAARRKAPRASRAGGFAKPKRRGGKLRTTYATKSGSYYGSQRGRGKAARRTTRAEHKALNTLSYRNRKAAHARRKGR